MKTLATILISIVLPVTSAFATQFVKSTGGVISKMTAESDFDACAKKIYRKAGQENLSPANKKQLGIESLKGFAVNDLGVLTGKLKGEDTCSYGADDEKF